MSSTTLLPDQTSIPLLKPLGPPVAPPTPPTHALSPDHIQKFQEIKTLRESIVDAVHKRCKEEGEVFAIDEEREKQRIEDLNWLDDGCLVRYLKATKFVVKSAVNRLEHTLHWRHTYKPTKIDPTHIVQESLTGKQILSGFDKHNRPILHLFPARENSKDVEMNLKFMVFNLEKTISVMPDGVDQMVIVIDFEGVGMGNCPSPASSRKVLT
ncbi:hypothetical protein HDU97_008531, partial [Phlyctochytrium planicorne]